MEHGRTKMETRPKTSHNVAPSSHLGGRFVLALAPSRGPLPPPTGAHEAGAVLEGLRQRLILCLGQQKREEGGDDRQRAQDDQRRRLPHFKEQGGLGSQRAANPGPGGADADSNVADHGGEDLAGIEPDHIESGIQKEFADQRKDLQRHCVLTKADDYSIDKAS